MTRLQALLFPIVISALDLVIDGTPSAIRDGKDSVEPDGVQDVCDFGVMNSIAIHPPLPAARLVNAYQLTVVVQERAAAVAAEQA